MREFNFKDRTEEFKIGEKVYRINLSNFEFMGKCKACISDLEEAQESLNKTNDAQEVLNALKVLIDLILDNDFDNLWEQAGHDFYSMIDLAVELSAMVKEGYKARNEKYLQSANRR